MICVAFNYPAFWQALDAVRRERDLSWYGISRATGVLTVREACSRRGLTVDSLAALLTWSGLRFEDYIAEGERRMQNA